MAYVVIGGLSFMLFCIYDINSILWKNKFLQFFFLLGFMGIGFSTMHLIWSLREIISSNIGHKYGWLAMGFVFMTLLIHSLFFALPFEKTYVNQAPKKVYTEGVYALCRHPGVLWFLGLYLSLYLLIERPLMLITAITFSFFNFLYIVLQDLWTFPKTFDDYEGYKQKTPFLIPNLASIQRCLSTLMHKTEGSYDLKK